MISDAQAYAFHSSYRTGRLRRDRRADGLVRWSRSVRPGGFWNDHFESSTDIGYFIEGQLALSLISRDAPARTVFVDGCTQASYIESGDIDDDGDEDLIVSSWGPKGLSWWENTAGEGTAWTEHAIDRTGSSPHCQELYDIDGDGDLDVAVALYEADQVAWFENVNGDGEEWTKHVVGSCNGPTWIKVYDIDNDGRDDFLTNSYLDHDAYIFYQGSSSWTQVTVSDDVFYNRAVDAADVDDDGDLDYLAVAQGGYSGGGVYWWENTGDDSWPRHDVDPTFQRGASLETPDIDGDGDPDVLLSSRDDPEHTVPGVVAWWENDNDGDVWTQHVVIDDFWESYVAAAADIDADGDLDIVASSEGQDRIRWFENLDGDGTSWDNHHVVKDYWEASAAWYGDVNGDERLDILGMMGDEDEGEGAWFDVTRYSSSGSLVSSILDKGSGGGWGIMHWVSESLDTESTDITFQVRSSNSAGSMGTWSPEIGANDFELSDYLDDGDRYVQYRVHLQTDDIRISEVLHSVALAYGSDSSPPQITHTPIETTPTGERLLVVAEVTDDEGLLGVSLYYRAAGSSEYSEVGMQGSGGNYTGYIPADVVGENGVEYYLWTTDGFNQTTAPTGGADAPYSIQITYADEGIDPGYDQHSGVTVADYRLFSVPTDYSGGGSPADVLEDDLGDYDRDIWRLARYQDGAFVEYTAGAIQDFAPGRAYWLIVGVDGVRLDSGPGRSPETSPPCGIPLEPGWNQIACPYPFPVAWREVIILGENGDLGDDLEDPVTYNGSYDYSADTLVPWEGCFVYYHGSGSATLYIPAIDDGAEPPEAAFPVSHTAGLTRGGPALPAVASEMAVSAPSTALTGISSAISPPGETVLRSPDPAVVGLTANDAAGTQPTLTTMNTEVEEPRWTIDLRLDSGGLLDAWNRVGVAEGASEYWDGAEHREPPYLAGAPNLVFVHDDWPSRRGEYASDIRPELGPGLEFDLVARPAAGASYALVSWQGVDDLPNGIGAVLIDDAVGVRVNLKTVGDYALEYLPGEGERALRLLVGPHDWLDDQSPDNPRNLYLAQSYPNPAAGPLTIEFGVARAGEVELAVYDLAGRRVATLFDDYLTPGQRVITWDGRGADGRRAVDGVYLYRLSSAEDVLTRRLVLSR